MVLVKGPLYRRVYTSLFPFPGKLKTNKVPVPVSPQTPRQSSPDAPGIRRRRLALPAARGKRRRGQIIHQLDGVIVLVRLEDGGGGLLVPQAVVPRLAAAGGAVGPGAEIEPRAGGLADGLDEAVEDDELELELDAVDAGLEGALQVEHVGALDAEQDHVEGEDDGVCVDELPQHRLLLLGLLGARGRACRRRRPRLLRERRPPAQVLARLEHVEDAEGRLLHEEDDELDPVPDEVEGGQVGVDGRGLLDGGRVPC